MSLLKLTGVKCHYKTPAGLVKALDGVGLDIHAAETVALVGESGCGKSTLAKLILGLAPLTAGNIEYDGLNTSTMNRAEKKHFRRQVQAVFQDPYSSLNPRLKVKTIITEPMLAHNFPKEQINKQLEHVLELVGLPAGAAKLYPHEFSGGQRQRIAIARSLTLEPKLIVLDEPISALDVSIRAQILNLLQDIQDELNIAYLLIAHDLALVEHASVRAAVMYLGRIVEYGKTDDVFAHPHHPYTQALLSAVPQPDPTVIRDSRLIQGEVASALAPPPGCHFHPRCPHATAQCPIDAPALVSKQSTLSACWLDAK
ncbi:MAG: oligopeptide/dipeptide ABC transporter ATP-binding protein [Pseudomonadota bacterium]